MNYDNGLPPYERSRNYSNALLPYMQFSAVSRKQLVTLARRTEPLMTLLFRS